MVTHGPLPVHTFHWVVYLPGMKLCVLFPGPAGVRGSGLLMSLFLSSLLSRVSLETPLELGSEPWSQQ